MSSRADYAPSRDTSAPREGAFVAAVEEGSPAWSVGVREGARVFSADGHALRDIIDWRWYADGPTVQVVWTGRQGDQHVSRLSRDQGEGWGIQFTEVVFDGVRTCRNRCSFCFMAQLPPGLRRSLYLRDDDFRLSFLQGNFITLTNLDESDVARILEQRLSPLYVSIHAVDPRVRERLICAREDRALEHLEALLEDGIEVHAQIVLVPTVNDGEVLDRTLGWLDERRSVASVGVVPVGYTRFAEPRRDSYSDPGAAAAVLSQLSEWQVRARRTRGTNWVYAADEFYLNAARPIPAAESYDSFPQYENGIGLVRTFLDELGDMQEELCAALEATRRLGARVALVTGEMAAGTIASALAPCGSDAPVTVQVIAVPNRFFGGNVAVAGLLTGADVLDAMRSAPADTLYLLPDVMLNSEGLTLDDMTMAEMRSASGADLRLVSSDAPGLLRGILSAVDHHPA